jgi:hypothetical protein
MSKYEATRLVYGRSAAAVGVGLLWFALWTVACNALVLAGFRYTAFLWALLATTAIVTIATRYFFDTAVGFYGTPVCETFTVSMGKSALPLRLVAALTVAVVAAAWTQRTESSLPYAGATALIALLIWRMATRKEYTPTALVENGLGSRLLALLILLVALYYLSHRPDLDDANFVNLAIGAQRTVGAVYQFDTMLSDGLEPILLPTYKFHSFELLGATISSVTGLEPIAVLHLILPLFQLALLTLILMLTLSPVAGSDWLTAAVLWIAFLFLNESTLATWGVHGIVRLFQGKGFLVSALLPLIAALTARWFLRGQFIDLLGLGLANVCAIGFSANGLYGGPLASGFVAAAFLATEPFSTIVWKRTACLLATLAYPVCIGAIIIFFKLALPSEVLVPPSAIDSLRFVSGFGLAGYFVLSVIAVGGIGFTQTRLSRAATAYTPLTMLLTLNPLSWRLIDTFTGNLGFRVFWSIPAASIAALVGLAILRRLGIRSEKGLLSAAVIALAAAIGWNNYTSGPLTAISWKMPDLKVVRPDYDLAQQLASSSGSSCRILAPEKISAWLTTIRGAPYPVFARELYLVHSRFTVSAETRSIRERLRLVVDGVAAEKLPSPADLAARRIRIGTIAVQRTAPSYESAASLAETLGLSGPLSYQTLDVWSGPCN